MSNYFYAYHGPKNVTDFDYSDGYGFKSEVKPEKTKDGDFVYVIQKRDEKDFFELCGLFEIVGRYHDKTKMRSYRLMLADKSNLPERIKINEDECSRSLPEISGDTNWTNFKRHFCRQGVSFQNPLSHEVRRVLEKILISQEDQKQEKYTDSDIQEDLDSLVVEDQYFEGTRSPRLTSYYERKPQLRTAAIRHHGTLCKICGFDFSELYGERGQGFIEVHHLIPVSSLTESTPVNPISEMTVVCANCHRMLHRKRDNILTPDQAREIVKLARSK